MLRIRRDGTDEYHALSRDVRDTHPQWVHDQMGTSDEAELQRAMDQYDIWLYTERLENGMGSEDTRGVSLDPEAVIPEYCSYCDADMRVKDIGPNPAVDDDEAWAREAKLHVPGGCEWVHTRAHRVEETASTTRR